MGKVKKRGRRIHPAVLKAHGEIVRAKKDSGIIVDPRIASASILDAMIGKEDHGSTDDR